MKVIALTGPAGAGKTTIATELSKRIAKCVNVEVDQLKHFIVNGFVYGKSTEGKAQWELLGRNIRDVTNNFVHSGYSVIINGYLSNEAWQVIEQSVKVDYKILLLPELTEVTERDAERPADVRLGEESIKEHHKHFSLDPIFADFLKIDSTGQTANETLKSVIDAIHLQTTNINLYKAYDVR